MYLKKEAFFIFFLILVLIPLAFGGRDGGYVFVYPKDEDSRGSLEVKSNDERKVISDLKIVGKKPLPKEIYKDRDKEEIVLLKKKLAAREKKIRILEGRIGKLEKKVREQELELYRGGAERKEYYLVKPGDNLWKIAAKRSVYGDPYKWITIYNANMNKIKEPDLIFPGQLFEIHRE